MKRTGLILLAASSLFLAVIALAESRPHYGGTLRIAMQEAPLTLDPPALANSGGKNISHLIFETLVTLDPQGRPQPLLAKSWETEPGEQRWRFLLRPGVLFHDGSPLDAASVVACLRSANPEWKVLAAGDNVVIETQVSDPEVPAELSLPREAIAKRSGEQPVGTGPFAIAEWVPGKRLGLRANDQYWAGRPYLDAIQIELGKNEHDQMIAIDLGKADIAEIPAENILRARTEGHQVINSEPEELMALVFSKEPRSEDEIHARNALALSLDTTAINDVVLQGGGEPSGALLPNWLSGYGFVFPAASNPEHSHPQPLPGTHFPSMTLAYDTADPIAHTIAERILLNARDADITLQLTTSAAADFRLSRLPLPSLDPTLALSELAKALQMPQAKIPGNSVTDLYAAEKTLLQSHRVIPLLHLRAAVSLRPQVRNFSMLPDGTWRIDNVWLSPEKP